MGDSTVFHIGSVFNFLPPILFIIKVILMSIFGQFFLISLNMSSLINMFIFQEVFILISEDFELHEPRTLNYYGFIFL